MIKTMNINNESKCHEITHGKSSMHRIRVIFLLALVLGLMQGCFGIGPKVGPDYSTPQLEMQDAWHQAITKGLAEGESNLQTWWKVLDDPVLNGLIERASQGNLELKVAFARIKEARAQSLSLTI